MNKKWLYSLAALVLIFVAFYLYQHYRVAPSVNFNTVVLTDLENRPVKFDALKGKKTVLCFGASWCGNCLEELEELGSIKDSELADVNVVVISDEPMERVKAFAARNSPSFLFLKMQQSFPSIGIHAIPVSYILNEKQEVKKMTVGYVNWTDASNREHLKKLMES
jgi:thiol-disulfide isomerase/thioredoxin